MNLTQTSLKIHPTQRTQLQQLAEAKGVSMSHLIRVAIGIYLSDLGTLGAFDQPCSAEVAASALEISP